jgi:hypothetical protein
MPSLTPFPFSPDVLRLYQRRLRVNVRTKPLIKIYVEKPDPSVDENVRRMTALKTLASR